MPLILPNTIQNAIPADGDKLGQNFATISDYVNQNAITSDGSTAMSAPLLLVGAPTQPNQAATKGYVDNSVPLGVMWEFAGDTAPTNWMLCQGQAISRATYAALFAVIATRFGAGDGATTFNLPDMRGRMSCGVNASGSYLSAGVGERFGNKDATLPSHTHGVNIWSNYQDADHGHNINLNTGTESASHDHNLGGAMGSGSGNNNFGLGLVGDDSQHGAFATTAGENQNHYHNVSGGTSGVTTNHRHAVNGSSDAAGVDATNGNLPPLVTFNYIMRVS